MALEHKEGRHQSNGLDRRGVLRAVGAGAATTVAAGALGSVPARAAAFTDSDLLNFALNFEYLGAEYYLAGLEQPGFSIPLGVNLNIDELRYRTGNYNFLVFGGQPVPFKNPAIQQYVQRLAADETAHVFFLSAMLGSAAIPEPEINLASIWNDLAVGAGLIAPGQDFNPFADDPSFLLGAYVLEDLCVTALAGAAALLTSKNNVEGMVGLLGTESYQAGAIRTLLANAGAGQATDAISALRARLSGVSDQGTAVPGNAYNFANTDSNALVFRRTPQEVLNIAYGGTGRLGLGGGFVPGGVKGAIR